MLVPRFPHPLEVIVGVVSAARVEQRRLAVLAPSALDLGAATAATATHLA
jgi:hypothetical protein